MVQDAVGNKDIVLWWCQWLLQVQFTFVYDHLHPLTTHKLWVTSLDFQCYGPKSKVIMARVRELWLINYIC